MAKIRDTVSISQRLYDERRYDASDVKCSRSRYTVPLMSRAGVVIFLLLAAPSVAFLLYSTVTLYSLQVYPKVELNFC